MQNDVLVETTGDEDGPFCQMDHTSFVPIEREDGIRLLGTMSEKQLSEHHAENRSCF